MLAAFTPSCLSLVQEEATDEALRVTTGRGVDAVGGWMHDEASPPRVPRWVMLTGWYVPN